MRTCLLVGLVAVNVVLAGAVAVHLVRLPQAHAQPMGLSGNFLMVNGTILGSASDAVYVVDLASRQLTAMLYDRSTQSVNLLGTRDLARDFGLTQPGGGMPRPGATTPRGRRGGAASTAR